MAACGTQAQGSSKVLGSFAQDASGAIEQNGDREHGAWNSGNTMGPWVEQGENSGMMGHLQERMTNMENALQQILVHLTNVPATSAHPETFTDSELPVIPMVGEWEDPWDA